MKHISSLKDLIPQALTRSNIGGLVVKSNTIRFASQFVASVLPPSRRSDAKVLSSREGTLTIECLNSPCAQFIREREKDLLDYVLRGEPKSDLEKVFVKIVGSFRTSEPG